MNMHSFAIETSRTKGTDLIVMATENRTSISLSRSTKNKLDEKRSPGQSYDGFIFQLIDFWGKSGEARIAYLESLDKSRHGKTRN